MKNLLFVLVAVASVIVSSCKNTTQETTTSDNTDTAIVVPADTSVAHPQ